MSKAKEEKYVSAEEHHVMHAAGQPHGPKPLSVQPRVAGLVVAAIVLCAVSFAGGVNYQKHHGKTAAANPANGAGGFSRSGFRGGQRGSFGQVTAVSASSITVQSQRTGTSTTYSITGSTTITDNGQTVAASDIKTGDTVVVMPASSGSTTAGSILVNPSFGGQQSQGGGDPAQSD